MARLNEVVDSSKAYKSDAKEHENRQVEALKDFGELFGYDYSPEELDEILRDVPEAEFQKTVFRLVSESLQHPWIFATERERIEALLVIDGEVQYGIVANELLRIAIDISGEYSPNVRQTVLWGLETLIQEPIHQEPGNYRLLMGERVRIILPSEKPSQNG